MCVRVLLCLTETLYQGVVGDAFTHVIHVAQAISLILSPFGLPIWLIWTFQLFGMLAFALATILMHLLVCQACLLLRAYFRCVACPIGVVAIRLYPASVMLRLICGCVHFPSSFAGTTST